tara:strand:- start:55 stop:861 length:807 start_codon:yes stop_codon:yes gene_type:complete
MIGFNYLGKLGQLGNQMFQYATVLGVAEKIGAEPCIPHHHEVLVDVLGNKLRVELFDCFMVKPERQGFVVTDRNYQESDFTFDEEIFDLDPEHDCNLVGFFQTDKYFRHIKDRIKEEFTFTDEIKEDCTDILECFDSPVALHIRRGDYLRNSDNHHNLSDDFYREALKEFDDDRQVIIFTDDPKYALENDLFSDDRFIVSEGNSSYHDLYMMTQCDDFIISNSTFSWWGAWLADKGKVVAPEKWFGPANAHKSTRDLYPEHWTILTQS